jgi:hypothetical protein
LLDADGYMSFKGMSNLPQALSLGPPHERSRRRATRRIQAYAKAYEFELSARHMSAHYTVNSDRATARAIFKFVIGTGQLSRNSAFLSLQSYE